MDIDMKILHNKQVHQAEFLINMKIMGAVDPKDSSFDAEYPLCLSQEMDPNSADPSQS